MADYEVGGNAEIEAQQRINLGPKMSRLLQSDVAPVEPAAETTTTTALNGFFLSADTQLLLAALCSCIVVFALVLSVFVRYKERIRRFVSGENRRVGSVYYVRPGMAATQPTEI